MKLRVLTLNAGLLQLFGRSMPTPFVPERLAALPGELRKVPCDLLLLQEVYGDARRRWLVKSLHDTFVYAVYPQKRRYFGLQNGQMVFSRYPASGQVELFRDAPLDETFFDSKGMLVTRHELPGNVVLQVVNLHTTAGGMFNLPEAVSIDSIRARQIDQVLSKTKSLDSPIIVAGDLNAGPGVSESNFRQMVDAGFVSTYDLLNGHSSEVTWDPLNPLNSDGPHKVCPPQRIDHLFLRRTDLETNLLRASLSKVCLQESSVAIPGGKTVTVSDHFGLYVEIELSIGVAPETGGSVA